MTDLSITPMERFTLRRLHAGEDKLTGARFAIHRRSDGRIPYAVSGAAFDWTEAGSARTVEEAQRAIEAVIASRKQASADHGASKGAS